MIRTDRKVLLTKLLFFTNFIIIYIMSDNINKYLHS